jgi:23S rRNA (uracil1939-C5)-methyltransferase
MSIDDCPHAKMCSGCIPNKFRLQIFDCAQQFFHKLGCDNYELIESISTGWRTRAKLAVRRGAKNLKVGLFTAGSHEVISIPKCLAHHDSITKIVATIEALPVELGYDEVLHAGDLRYIQVTIERQTGCAQLTFVLNIDETRRRLWRGIAEKVYAESDGLIRSIYLNYQQEATNRIFGERFELVCGDAFVYERILDRIIPIVPSHFSQAHMTMFERLLTDLVRYVDRRDTVVELYAGMGVISLVLAPFCSSLLAIEREPSAEEAFLSAVSYLPPHIQSRMRFLVGDAGQSMDALSNINTVLVDPPRKGLPATLVASILKAHHIEKVFYISCHFPCLQRDLERFLETQFRITFARSYRFFPGTDHIETLVVLQRRGLAAATAI